MKETYRLIVHKYYNGGSDSYSPGPPEDLNWNCTLPWHSARLFRWRSHLKNMLGSFFFASDRVETFMLLQKKISVDVNFKVIKEYVQIKNVNLSKSRWFFKKILLCKHSNVCFLLSYNIMIITVTHLIKNDLWFVNQYYFGT